MEILRFRAAILAFIGALTAFFALLWSIQMINGPDWAIRARQGISQVELVPAIRGRLLDRNGAVFVQDKTIWQGTVSDQAPADSRRRFAELCQEEQVPWSGSGPASPLTPQLLVRLQEEALQGIQLRPVTQRQGSGTLAPHVLGRVGPMNPQEWTNNQSKGYAMDERVGKDGAEAAFQDLLRGIPGRRIIETDRTGVVTGSHWEKLPQPGTDLTLTLDRQIQLTAQEALSQFLSSHPKAVGGAVAVVDITDGGVLALASAPGYDADTFSSDYESLASDPAHPVMNRAIQGLYAPGSTFKLVTAVAALEDGILTPETQILDTGRYTYYKNPQPQCWLYRQEKRTHGLETVSEAITDSCNIFFYDAGRRVGISRLEDYARALGLGEPTGIELPGEPRGVVAGPTYTQSIGGTWYEGNVLSAAIGQENNRFTPLQLANMTATIASGGTRQRIHLLRQVGHQPPIVNPPAGCLPIKEVNLSAIKEGMENVTRTGSLSGAFRDLPLRAAAKTGSAQVTGAKRSNAVLVCFAPVDDPKIALAAVVEQGGSGSSLGPIAVSVLRSYFSLS